MGGNNRRYHKAATMMKSSLASLGLNLSINSSRNTSLPIHQTSKARESNDWEKRGEVYEDFSEEDDSSYPSSPHSSSSRTTFDSHPSNRPMIRRIRKSREAPYKLPARLGRNLVCILILAVLGCIGFLIYMGQMSTKSLELYHERRKSQPKPWESYEFLSRYYGGIRTLLPAEKNKPEYPHGKENMSNSNDTTTSNSRDGAINKISTSKSFNPYPDYQGESYLSEFESVQECFLDAGSTIRIPPVQYYDGRPSGFPDNVMGSYELLDIQEDICLDRYGRYGPYGHGYGVRLGGLGSGLMGDAEGSEAVWEKIDHADYRKVDWAVAQGRCYDSNSARFKAPSPFTLASLDLSLSPKETKIIPRVETLSPKHEDAAVNKPKTKLPRTAVVVRTWDSFEYGEEDIMWLRSLISELSLGSGGEYDIHLLVQVKNETIPIFADEEAYEDHLHNSVPEEFWGISTLWTETQMQMLYKRLLHLDTHPRGDDLHVHGVYRGLIQALQYFSHNHPEYDFFWQLEMDIRFIGHTYDLFSKFGTWAKKQPRKGLWERNGRYYVPSIHGTWDDFVHLVRVQTETGGTSPNDMFSGVKGFTTSKVSTSDDPIWGPKRPDTKDDWFEIENDIIPPTSQGKDKGEWGVGEDADLITLNPMFDPAGTEWGLKNDVTGYNTTFGLPPRRAAIITASRMSKRLLTTMHRESAFKSHHAFPEMWPATTALHHGYKAVYVPHPMFVDREWDVNLLAGTMNAGRNGASGGARTSVFSEDREHNTKGLTFYYNADFPGNLYRRWMGLKLDNEGGEQFEMEGRVIVNETARGLQAMKGGEGRMCLPPMVLHPVKGVELPVESIHLFQFDALETDPSS